MSFHEVQSAAPPSEPTAKNGIPWRALLLGLGIALFVGVLLLLLSVRTGAAQSVPLGNSLLLLAPAAFVAGVISFLSPCTLPILPAYFAFTFQARREHVLMTTVAFFLGLASTMVVLGASATALSRVLFQNLNQLQLIGGIVIVVFGVMSLLGKGFGGAKLLDRPSAGVVGSYLYGATFALGWTACVGPILGALLTLLTTQGLAVVQGAVLAFIYALGLGTPLIIVATFFSRLGKGSRAWQIMRGRGIELNLGFTTLYTHSTSIISGALLIGMGALLATGQLADLSRWSQSTPMAQWALHLEQAFEGLLLGR